MSYCLNPNCNSPNNAPTVVVCQACGSTLLLRDRYRSSRILGRGGFATTFLAVDEGLPGLPTCVIKQLRPVLNSAQVLEMSRELFQREAATLGKIGNHPQLPRLLDYFELGTDFYLIQEYVSGATLQQEVRRSGQFDEAMTKEVLREVLPILDYLHQQQVIHRDIKPANIIRRSIDKKLVLIDFGAVKDQVNQAAANNPENTTLTAFAVGTPGFAPPEQMAMRPVYASDVYSLGITCVYLLTGKSPKDLNYSQSTGELEWQSRVQISLPFQRLLEKMLEVSLRDRYQNAQEVTRALDGLESKSDPSPLSNSSMYTFERPSQRSTTAGNRSVGRTAGKPSARSGAQDPMADSFSKIVARKPTSRSGSNGGADPSGTTKSGGRKSIIKLSPQGLLQAYGQGKRDFSDHDLSNLSMPRIQLSDAVFHEAQFQNSDLRGADLNGANLGKASLVGANLRNANLQEAYLSYADLEGADLRGADLSNAYLSNANLRGANLCGANLTGATLMVSQLNLAHLNWMTILPNGKRGKGLW
jgi:serine/threonine protein kinase, bacterial